MTRTVSPQAQLIRRHHDVHTKGLILATARLEHFTETRQHPKTHVHTTRGRRSLFSAADSAHRTTGCCTPKSDCTHTPRAGLKAGCTPTGWGSWTDPGTEWPPLLPCSTDWSTPGQSRTHTRSACPQSCIPSSTPLEQHIGWWQGHSTQHRTAHPNRTRTQQAALWLVNRGHRTALSRHNCRRDSTLTRTERPQSTRTRGDGALTRTPPCRRPQGCRCHPLGQAWRRSRSTPKRRRRCGCHRDTLEGALQLSCRSVLQANLQDTSPTEGPALAPQGPSGAVWSTRSGALWAGRRSEGSWRHWAR